MNQKEFALWLILLALLGFGLPLPTFHATYSKFVVLSLLCGIGLVVCACIMLGAMWGGRRARELFTSIGVQLAGLMRMKSAIFLIGLLAISWVSLLWAGSLPAWRWSVLFLSANVVWTVRVILWLRGGGDCTAILTAYMMVAVAASMVGMVLFGYDIWTNPSLWGEPTHRLMHPLGNPNFMASFLITPFLLVVACAMEAAERHHSASLIMYTAMGVLLMVAFLLTGSRGGGLGLATAFFILLLMRMEWKRRLRTVLFLAVLLIIAVVVALSIEKFRDWLREEAYMGTNVARAFLWPDALRMIASRPLLGWGAGGFTAFHDTIKQPQAFLYYYLQPSAISPHNEFLHMGVDFGLIGLGLYAAFLVSLIAGALRAPGFRARPLTHKAVVAGFIGVIVHSCFDVTLRFWDLAPFFWMMGAIILSFQLDEAQNSAHVSTDASSGPGPHALSPRGAHRWLLGVSGLLMLGYGLAWCGVAAQDLTGQMHMLAGRRAQKRMEYGGACAAYQSAMKQLFYFPDLVTTRIYLSECLQAEGRVREAIAVLSDLQNEAPNVRRSNLKLGLLYLQAFDQQARSSAERSALLRSCIACIQKHLKNNDDAEGYFGLARAFIRESPPAYEQAVSALNKCLTLSPRHVTARRLMVGCLHDLKKDKEALPHAEAVLRSKQAIALDYVILANIQMALGDKTKPMEILKFAEKLFPGDPAIREAQKRILNNSVPSPQREERK